MEDAREKSDLDYLRVTSRPPTNASRGKAFSYAMSVKSKKGGVKYKIDKECLSVSGSTEQEVFHTFKIMIE